MEKLISLIVFLSFLSTSGIGQNWKLIPADDQLNFLEDGQNAIQHTIWSDSISINDSTIIYHLNRVVSCDNPPSDCLRNQAGVLGKEIIVQGGQHRFGVEASLTLLPNASLGTTWLYDSFSNTTAEVVATEQASVWGTIDSVKTIALSNLDTILLSKDFGLLSYPTDTTNYTTVGIDNLGLGETVPDFFDIFEFEVGDIFYYEHTSSASQGNGEMGSMSRFKLEILSRTIFSDRLEYTVRRLGYNYFWGQGPPTTDNFDQVQTISFVYSPAHPANFYHRDLVVYGDEEAGNGPFWALMFAAKDEQGRYTKSIGQQAAWNTFNGSGFDIDLTTDTLQLHSGPDEFHITYKEGLGETKYVYWFFEVAESCKLIGYIKHGVEVGEIIPDADLTVSINELAPPNSLVIYPNPTQDYLTIQFPTETEITGQWEIRNLAGKLLLAGQYKGEALSIATLKAGLYLLTVTRGEQIYTGKVVKH